MVLHGGVGARSYFGVLRAREGRMETMKSAGYITAACALSVALAAASEPNVAAELLAGMMAPLVVAVATMVLVERTYRRNPEELTALMIKGFGTKMIILGAYVGERTPCFIDKSWRPEDHGH